MVITSAIHPIHARLMEGRDRGYDLTTLRARQVERADFARFDWLLAMDAANLA